MLFIFIMVHEKHRESIMKPGDLYVTIKPLYAHSNRGNVFTVFKDTAVMICCSLSKENYIDVLVCGERCWVYSDHFKWRTKRLM